MDKALKEHKTFRNQLIIMSIILSIASYFMIDLLIFAIMLGLIALFNVFTYKVNVRDYNKLNNKKYNG